MGVTWQEQKDDVGFVWHKSDCSKYTCFAGKYQGMAEDGSVSEHKHWILMKAGIGYAGGAGILGLFNTAKEATTFTNECETAQHWPSHITDRRTYLADLERFVTHHGNIARARREAEAEAKRVAEAELEAQRAEAAAAYFAKQEAAMAPMLEALKDHQAKQDAIMSAVENAVVVVAVPVPGSAAAKPAKSTKKRNAKREQVEEPVGQASLFG